MSDDSSGLAGLGPGDVVVVVVDRSKSEYLAVRVEQVDSDLPPGWLHAKRDLPTIVRQEHTPSLGWHLVEHVLAARRVLVRFAERDADLLGQVAKRDLVRHQLG